jgi:hypothetical protein
MKRLLPFILVLLMAVPAWADNETIRPTGAYQTTVNWANLANAYDDSLTTAASITPGNDDILYVGATVDIATDAWDAPSQSWDSGTLYCTYGSTGFSNNDTIHYAVVNGAGTSLVSLQDATGAAIATTTKSYVLTGGYLSDQTDLRCVGAFERTAGADSGTAYIYEVWIEGTYTAAAGASRRRMVIMQ